ncbi:MULTISPECIES: hypothetical protein [Caballeronia]|uniref:hypothetical protein n=1 Tax=Caballeronia TaxID=1827195 RepID=UPI001FD0294C|nr:MULTISPECIES: hypothetical protein [Caballeronia]MDR5798957.1 hypothetical protein [Caballeronia sp. LZ001]
MIIVIVTSERDPKTGRLRRVVSHGVDSQTDRLVVLPCDPPEAIGAVWNADIGEYVIL